MRRSTRKSRLWTPFYNQHHCSSIDTTVTCLSSRHMHKHWSISHIFPKQSQPFSEGYQCEGAVLEKRDCGKSATPPPTHHPLHKPKENNTEQGCVSQFYLKQPTFVIRSSRTIERFNTTPHPFLFGSFFFYFLTPQYFSFFEKSRLLLWFEYDICNTTTRWKRKRCTREE